MDKKIKNEINILIDRLSDNYSSVEYISSNIIIRPIETKSAKVYFLIWSTIPLIFSIYFFQKSILISLLLLFFFFILRYVNALSKKHLKLTYLELDLTLNKIIYANIDTSYTKKEVNLANIISFNTIRSDSSIIINSVSKTYYSDLKCKTNKNEVINLFRISASLETRIKRKEKALSKFISLIHSNYLAKANRK